MGFGRTGMLACCAGWQCLQKARPYEGDNTGQENTPMTLIYYHLHLFSFLDVSVTFLFLRLGPACPCSSCLEKALCSLLMSGTAGLYHPGWLCSDAFIPLALNNQSAKSKARGNSYCIQYISFQRWERFTLWTRIAVESFQVSISQIVSLNSRQDKTSLVISDPNQFETAEAKGGLSGSWNPRKYIKTHREGRGSQEDGENQEPSITKA